MPRQKIYASDTYPHKANTSCKLVLERLGNHLKDQGISYRSLAESLGVSHPTVARWLAVPGVMNLEQFFLVVQALHLDENDIYELFDRTSMW